jgi:hypothetical protein
MVELLGIPSTFVAVEWSGAKTSAGQRKGICVAVAGPSGVTASAGRTRGETVELIEQLAEPVAVGFDFSFGAPAWFAREHVAEAIDDVWALAARDGDDWLGPPPMPPFWQHRCDVPAAQQFRQCEAMLKRSGIHPASLFALVGAKQVGAGSVRGMPYLARLRASGFAIWPFDSAAHRTVVEIYPTALRPMAGEETTREFANDHERDAVLSAAVMWEHRASFATLTAATDPVTLLEGDVWMPPTLGNGRAS